MTATEALKVLDIRRLKTGFHAYVELDELIRKMQELLLDAEQRHCDPNSSEYNECEVSACHWCEELNKLK